MKIDQLNSLISKRFPRTHALARKLIRRYLPADDPSLQAIPIPRKVAGKVVWLHPRFLSYDVDNEPSISRAIQDSLQVGSCFFDIGAWVGITSCLASALVGEKGRVVACEPSPANLHWLRFHAERQRHRNIAVVSAAISVVGDSEVSLTLLNGGESSSNSMTTHFVGDGTDDQEPAFLRVPTRTIDQLSKEYGPPDLIKVDVEGAELLVLQGASTTLQQYRPKLILSTHPAWLPETQKAKNIDDFLRQMGYQIRLLSSGEPACIDEGFRDYLCVALPGIQ